MQVIKCLAAVAWEQNKFLSIETVEVAPPKTHEVRVKIHSTGVCHTDLSTLSSIYPDGPGNLFPTILGHEGAGVVESVGDELPTNVMLGDHVIPMWLPHCGTCHMCRSEKTNICEKAFATLLSGMLQDGTSRFSCNGKVIYHYVGTSTLSQYIVLPYIFVVKVNPSACLDRVCFIGCGIPTGYGSV
ncbi:unnamed protein product [Darwinula stevensoni]|uniref:Alcohol dehydrogenase-like N-terminal domain-containing protein n=1 Tax=Darwinula stevensoni TaxID=69355 RepID=A0A7R9AF66_9CRUS|nr:unnamed protein product [Darwinula stevensoni]CAG0902689.1 unnamed protein product [Darwinula stevensoni]